MRRVAEEIPSHMQACWDAYSKRAGWQGFTIAGGVDENGRIVHHIWYVVFCSYDHSSYTIIVDPTV